MKKLIVLLVAVILLAFSSVGADKPGRIHELEARVQQLENKLQGYETLKMEVSNLESYCNFILSDEFAEIICVSCSY